MRNNLLHKDISLSIYIIYTVVSFSIFYYGFCNVESYDAIISAFCAQEYYTLGNDMFFWDTNTFIIPLISWLNSYFPGIQLFGYYLLGITAIVGYLYLNLILTHPLLNRQKRIILALSFIILHSANFFFLQTTRIAVLTPFLFFLYYTFSSVSRFKIFFIFIFCLLLRFDAFLLISALYIVCIYLLKLPVKHNVWLPFGVAILVTLIFNVLLYYTGPDTFKIFYYYELELMDKSNIDFVNLSKIDSFIIYNLKTHLIFDEKLFNLDFIKSILLVDSSHFTNNFLKPELYINVFKNSLPYFYLAKEILIVACLFFLINFFTQNFRLKMFYLITLLFPLLICFYVMVPLRFIYPYYIFYILLSISTLPNKKSYYYSIVVVILLATSIHVKNLYSGYETKRNNFKTTIEKVESLKFKHGEVLFFENLYSREWNFITTDISYKYTGNNIFFLNLGFFQFFQLYPNEWKKILGTKNSYSMFDKINYLENSNYPLFIDDEKYVKVYKEYLMKRYDYATKAEFVLWDE